MLLNKIGVRDQQVNGLPIFLIFTVTATYEFIVVSDRKKKGSSVLIPMQMLNGDNNNVGFYKAPLLVKQISTPPIFPTSKYMQVSLVIAAMEYILL